MASSSFGETLPSGSKIVCPACQPGHTVNTIVCERLCKRQASLGTLRPPLSGDLDAVYLVDERDVEEEDNYELLTAANGIIDKQLGKERLNTANGRG